MSGFSVNIGANTGQLVKSLLDLQGQLKRFQEGLKTATNADTIGRLNRAIAATKERMDALKGFQGVAGLKEIPPAANQATNALTALSRGVQDLPFGAAGFANNIEGIVGGFSQMVKQSGSAKEAFKSLGASLMGGGGLMLAIGAVSTAMTLSSQGFFQAKTAAHEFEKALEEANKQAGEEIARVQVLNAVITDNTRTQKERSDAAKELSGILKELNINMSQEAILNGQVEEATKKVTEAIISRAKARAAEARIADLSGKNLDRDFKRHELTDKLTAAEKKYQEQLANRGKIRNKDQIEAAGLDQFNTISAMTAIRKSIVDIDKETEKANKEISFLIDQIKEKDHKIVAGGGGEEVDLLKQRIAALKEIQSLQGLTAKQQVELVQLEIQLINRDGLKLGFKPAEIKAQADAILEKAFPVKTFEYDTVITTRVNKLEVSTVKDPAALTDGFKTDIAKAIGIDGKPLEIPAPPVTINGLDKELKKAMDQFKESMKQPIGEAAILFSEGIADIFSGKSIGEVLGNTAKGLMEIVGNMLQQVGKNMILASTAVEALTTALAGLFGPGGAVAGIAAGALLVTVGALIKKVDMPKFATGGIVTGPIIGQIGEMHRPEVIMPLDRLPQMLRSFGGNGGNEMQLIPIVNNEGLYLAVKRGERKAGRRL